MTALFALTTHGLELVAADELGAHPACEITEIGYRRVAVRLDPDYPVIDALTSLLTARTLDDLFVQVAAWRGIGHERSALAVLQERSAALRLDGALCAIAAVRTLPHTLHFSVTANFVGRRNYTTPEIKAAVAAGISQHTTWQYRDDDRDADLNLRVFLEHDSAVVGIRLGRTPLARRVYKQYQNPGSLKPTVAAAMLRLAGMPQGARMLDPCCGAGTLVIEAAQSGFQAWGGDSDAAALTAARENARLADAPCTLELWDARSLPLPDSSIDLVASNLPWGGQISMQDSPARFYAAICAEIERVLTPGGVAVLLVEQPELPTFTRLRCIRQLPISLFGRTPTIMQFG